MSIAVVVGTYNRAPDGPNYLAGLLGSLQRSGLWTSGLLADNVLHIVDGGSTSLTHLEALRERGGPVAVHPGARGQHANETFAHMARVGVETDAEWVVTLEDDVVVVQNFLAHVADWALGYATSAYALLPLYCPYQDVVWAQARGEFSWCYPVASFYGTQGLLWRRADLVSYVDWYARAGEKFSFWDMLIKEWAAATYPQAPDFLTPVPSFVQHVGRWSALGLHDRFHTAPCFAGEA